MYSIVTKLQWIALVLSTAGEGVKFSNVGKWWLFRALKRRRSKIDEKSTLVGRSQSLISVRP